MSTEPPVTSRCRFPDWSRLRELLTCDPGGRGLASNPEVAAILGHHALEQATADLLRGDGVAILTGFCIADADPPAAETDGPPGALYLARVLAGLGRPVALISDPFGGPLLQEGLRHLGISRVELLVCPLSDPPSNDARSWLADFWKGEFAARLTHLVAIERVGPSHTLESLAGEPRNGPSARETFERETPLESRDVCHNMRGMNIDRWTAPLHRLFEVASGLAPRVKTIGIGDGGNELGMGSIPWETLHRAIAIGPAAKTACRIPADFPLVAGTSNWGAYALAAAVGAMAGIPESAVRRGSAHELSLVESLVENAGAVDGVSKKRQPTVDGISSETYAKMVDEIEEAAWGTVCDLG